MIENLEQKPLFVSQKNTNLKERYYNISYVLEEELWCPKIRPRGGRGQVVMASG